VPHGLLGAIYHPYALANKSLLLPKIAAALLPLCTQLPTRWVPGNPYFTLSDALCVRTGAKGSFLALEEILTRHLATRLDTYPLLEPTLPAPLLQHKQSSRAPTKRSVGNSVNRGNCPPLQRPADRRRTRGALRAGGSGLERQWLCLKSLLSFITFSLGWLLFAIGTLRARVFPRAAAILLIVGAVFVFLPLLFTTVVFAVAVAWLGFALFTGGEASAEQPSRVS
jgi:hypothetical protein